MQFTLAEWDSCDRRHSEGLAAQTVVPVRCARRSGRTSQARRRNSSYMEGLCVSRRKYDQKRNSVFISSLCPMPVAASVLSQPSTSRLCDAGTARRRSASAVALKQHVGCRAHGKHRWQQGCRQILLNGTVAMIEVA